MKLKYLFIIILSTGINFALQTPTLNEQKKRDDTQQKKASEIFPSSQGKRYSENYFWFRQRNMDLMPSYKAYQGNVWVNDDKMFLELKKNKEVNTLWGTRQEASRPYRRFVFELLAIYRSKRLAMRAFFEKSFNIKLNLHAGFAIIHPEAVILMNDCKYISENMQINEYTLMINPSSPVKGRVMEYNECTQNKNLFGVTRLIFLHEIAHLAEEHIEKSRTPMGTHIFLQGSERMADFAAQYMGDCTYCCQDHRDFYIKQKSDSPKDYSAIARDRFIYFNSLSASLLKKMDDKQLSELAIEARRYSALYPNRHPFDFERVLFFELAARDLEKAHALCNYHKKYGPGLTTQQMFERAAKDTAENK